MYQGVILTFKSYYLRNTFSKAIAAVDWKLSGKEVTILGVIKEHLWLIGECQKININRKMLEEVNSSTQGYLWGVKTSAVGIAREPELRVEPEDETGL
jgi:hypothetical protein